MEGEITFMESLATAISNGVTQVATLMDSALDLAIGNPLVMIFVASALVGIGVGAFQKLKNVA